MTGYGAGESARNGWKTVVELSSVNRKQSEVAVNVPRELEVLEARIREEVQKAVSRGRVAVRVTLHTLEGKESAGVRLNKGLARAYARELERLAAELRLSGGVTLDHLLRAPGVLQSDSDWLDAEGFWPAVQAALGRAMRQMLGMRSREGACLRADLVRRVSAMRKSAARVARVASRVLKRYREQLVERVREAGLNPAELDPDRMAKEVVLFADRSDISEELTRLESHFQQFDKFLESAEPVGRTLDFLAQEMNREINTIGSKANDAGIAHEVVILKTELEKFREQVQNVE